MKIDSNVEEESLRILGRKSSEEILYKPLDSVADTDALPSESSSKGPRSRIVTAILLLLYARPMKSSDIAHIVGKSTKMVSSYLSYWKSRGYVVYRSGYWMLTKVGEEYVRIFLNTLGREVMTLKDVVQLAHKLITEPDLQTVNNWTEQNGDQKRTEIQSFIVEKTGSNVGKQANISEKVLECITRVLNSKDLLEDEMNVLNYLIKHYIEWGSTYLYLDQIADELHYPSNELMVILRKLQTKKLIYLYTDRRFGIRVGLGRTFKQFLDNCASKR